MVSARAITTVFRTSSWPPRQLQEKEKKMQKKGERKKEKRQRKNPEMKRLTAAGRFAPKLAVVDSTVLTSTLCD